MKSWRVKRYGPPSEALNLEVVDDLQPSSGQVRIRVSTAPLNLNDADMCRGIYPTISPPLPFPLGMEVCGVVDATSPDMESWMDRRVLAVPVGGHGGYAEQAVSNNPFEAPEQLDDVHAAAFLIPFLTAYVAVCRRGKVLAGETMVVHSAAGGVGSAALQLGIAAGARVIATASSAEKLAFCKELGAEILINYQKEQFAETVLDATSGEGADVICDLVGGDVARESFKCIKREGRYLVAGFSAGQEYGEKGLSPRLICKGNFDVLGCMFPGDWIGAPSREHRASGANPFSRRDGDEMYRHLLLLLEQGLIRPLVGQVRPFTDIPAALEDLESRRTLGRTVIRIGADGVKSATED